MSDAGLAHLKDHKNLKRLELQGTKVSDLSPLKDMPLEEIRLTPRNITTRGLDILRNMKSLKDHRHRLEPRSGRRRSSGLATRRGSSSSQIPPAVHCGESHERRRHRLWLPPHRLRIGSETHYWSYLPQYSEGSRPMSTMLHPWMTLSPSARARDTSSGEAVPGLSQSSPTCFIATFLITSRPTRGGT